MPMEQWVTVRNITVVMTTTRVIGVCRSGDRDDVVIWLPRSHLLDSEPIKKGDEEIVVKYWLAKQEGLI